MTPKQRAARIRELEEELEKLHSECPHEELRRIGESEYCKGCGKDLGWVCKESPDGVCHYYTTDKKVELVGGVLVDPPKDHDFGYETADSCIYCGAPEERK